MIRNRWIRVAFAGMSLTVVPIIGQTGKPYSPPRLADGHPDFQGTYDLATVTPFERLPGDPPFLTKEVADAKLKAELARRAEDNKPD